MANVYSTLEQMADGIKSALAKYLIENNADYVALVDGECIDRFEYKKKSFTDFGSTSQELEDTLEWLVPVLITSLEKGNCDRLGVEFTKDNFEVRLSECTTFKNNEKKIGIKIVTPDIDEKTAAFEIRKVNDEYAPKINGTFICHKELFQKLKTSSNLDYFLISYFKDYFMDDIITKEKEFKIKSEKIRSLSLAVKELIDLNKI